MADKFIDSLIVDGGKTDSEADRQIHTYYNAVDLDIVTKLNRQTGRWIGEQMDRQTDGQTVWYTE